jgi:hypothetical protein
MSRGFSLLRNPRTSFLVAAIRRANNHILCIAPEKMELCHTAAAEESSIPLSAFL